MKKYLSLLLASVLLLLTFSGSAAASAETVSELNIVELMNGNNIDMSAVSRYIQAGTPKKAARLKSASSLPAAYDSRDRGIITPVKDQGNSGDCWAFSAISVIETESILNGYATIENADFSEAHLAWFTGRSASSDPNDHNRNEGETVSSPHTRGGSWNYAAATLSRWCGIANESDFPFAPYQLEDMEYAEEDRFNTGSGVVLHSAYVISDTEQKKSWVMEHGSMQTSIYYDSSYVIYKNSDCSYYCNVTNPINHAITIIGWDDNYPAANFNSNAVPPSDGAWLCKDSWGTNQRKDGFFWVSYYDASMDETVGYTVQPADKFSKNYTYNGAHWEVAVQHSSGAVAANVFNAPDYEKLGAVSAYTLQDGVTLDINIYTGVPTGSSSNPEKGTLVYSTSQYIQHSGYHTVDFPEAVSIPPGRFAVSIKYTHPSGQVVVPVEYTGGSVTTTYSSYESYYLLRDNYSGGWKEASFFGIKNAFIQAFTNCDHYYVDDIDEPTCRHGGHFARVCARCGDVAEEYDLDQVSHRMTEWEEEIDGVRVKGTRECVFCGLTESYEGYTVRTTSLEELFDVIARRLSELFARIIYNLMNR